jgi:hypothetical protein
MTAKISNETAIMVFLNIKLDRKIEPANRLDNIIMIVVVVIVVAVLPSIPSDTVPFIRHRDKCHDNLMDHGRRLSTQNDECRLRSVLDFELL